jgi:hypothetical protein
LVKIADGIANKHTRAGCRGRECVELLRELAPTDPPSPPGGLGSCAVVGNHGDMKGSGFGRAIDAADAVIRLNDAPTRCVRYREREREREREELLLAAAEGGPLRHLAPCAMLCIQLPVLVQSTTVEWG